MAKRSLLLVDGDTRSLRVLEVSLKKAGFTVTTASDGASALEIVEVSPPDLIISNTKLDGVDGFEFCRAVKNNPTLAATPFVFLTDQTEIEHKIRGLELGVDEYLIKPIYIKEILTRVRIILQKAERNSLEGRNKPNTRFTGKLSDMGVVDLIQTVEVSGKSGVSHFSAPSGAVSSLYFRDGRVIDAELGPLTGADAVYRLLTWNEGDFEVLFRSVRRRDVIKLSPQALLMEGMRRLDEWGRLLEQLPALKTRFEVAYGELAERLAELPDELNELLRLFDGHRSLMDIVDQTPQGDLESLELIAKLYFEGLVVESQIPEPTGETWPPRVADREDPIDLPPARVREATANELEHDPGDDVYEDIALRHKVPPPPPPAPESNGDARPKPKRHKSLVDIAIGEVAPVFPGLELVSSPSDSPDDVVAEADGTAAIAADVDEDVAPDAAGQEHPRAATIKPSDQIGRLEPGRREIAMIPSLVERVRHSGEREGRAKKISSQPPPVPARRAPSSSQPPIADAPRVRASSSQPPAADEPRPRASSSPPAIAAAPPPATPVTERARTGSSAPPPPATPVTERARTGSSAPPPPATPVTERARTGSSAPPPPTPENVPELDAADVELLSESEPEAPRPTLELVPEPDAAPEPPRRADSYPPVEMDGEVTPVVADTETYPSFHDEFTPTPARLEEPRPPALVPSDEPSSLRVISSDGAEIVAVAGAISALGDSSKANRRLHGSIVIEDDELREDEFDESMADEPTVEEPLGQRARRSSPPPTPAQEKSSPLPLYFGVAAAALLLGLLFMLRRGPAEPTEPDQNALAGSSAVVSPSAPDAAVAVVTPADAAPVAEVPIDAEPIVIVEIDAGPTPRQRAKDFERRATRARSQGRVDEALGHVNQAISIRPTGRNMALRADLLYALGRRREAIIAADAALRMSPGSASAWRSKGLAHYENKEYGAAKRALGKYLEIRPTGESSDRIRTIYDKIDQ